MYGVAITSSKKENGKMEPFMDKVLMQVVMDLNSMRVAGLKASSTVKVMIIMQGNPMKAIGYKVKETDMVNAHSVVGPFIKDIGVQIILMEKARVCIMMVIVMMEIGKMDIDMALVFMFLDQERELKEDGKEMYGKEDTVGLRISIVDCSLLRRTFQFLNKT